MEFDCKILHFVKHILIFLIQFNYVILWIPDVVNNLKSINKCFTLNYYYNIVTDCEIY